MSYHIMSYHIISINQSLEYSVYHIHQKEVLHHRISYDRRRKNGQEKLNLNGRTKRGFPVFKKRGGLQNKCTQLLCGILFFYFTKMNKICLYPFLENQIRIQKRINCFRKITKSN